MNQRQAGKHLSLWFAGAALLGLGYGLAHVRADGAPKTQPLWYAGTVADAAGAPLEGNHSVSLRLFPALTGGSPACATAPTAVVFQKGRFRLDASAEACVTAVSGNPDLFAELSVDDKPFPRSKLGAVPYALEAQHAVTATSAMTSASAAAASGALETRIKALETRLGPATGSAFRARRDAALSMTTRVRTVIGLPQEDYDLNAEFDGTSFTPKVAGYYQISCTIHYSVQNTGTFYLNVVIMADGAGLMDNGSLGDAWSANRIVSGVVYLAANKPVTCNGVHEDPYTSHPSFPSPAGQSRQIDSALFSATRINL